MMYSVVTDLAADGVPVAVTCRVLEFSKQGYYRWRASPVTERNWADTHLVSAAMDIHDDDPAFASVVSLNYSNFPAATYPEPCL